MLTLDLHLAESMERLNTRPHSIEEIGLAKKEWQGCVCAFVCV